MGSELERRAKEWVEGEPKETADLLELGFRAGWKVCREAAKKYAEERFETYLMFLDNFGDEPEEVKKKYVSATISKEAMEASKDKEFMKLVKDWRAEKSRRSFKDDPPPQTGVHLEGIDSRGLRDHFYWSLTNRRFQQEEFNKDAFNPDEIVWWTYALPEPKEGE